jgi:hypothetical protein
MDIITAVVTFILGGGFLSFVQWLIQRNDTRKDEIGNLKKYMQEMEKRITEKITQMEEKADERNAVNSRVRILRFADEIGEGKRPSKDSFDQCLRDIDEYEDYCNRVPTFKNNQTAATVAHIKRVYAERLEKHDFL